MEVPPLNRKEWKERTERNGRKEGTEGRTEGKKNGRTEGRKEGINIPPLNAS